TLPGAHRWRVIWGGRLTARILGARRRPPHRGSGRHCSARFALPGSSGTSTVSCEPGHIPTFQGRHGAAVRFTAVGATVPRTGRFTAVVATFHRRVSVSVGAVDGGAL